MTVFFNHPPNGNLLSCHKLRSDKPVTAIGKQQKSNDDVIKGIQKRGRR
jgi:hypothetical protein